MHINQPGRLPVQENSPTTPATPSATNNTSVKPTKQDSFSSAHRTQSQTTSTSNPTNTTPKVSELNHTSIFSSRAFSPEFKESYIAARVAIESPENKYYENQLGWLSPTAEAAVKKLASVVANKSSNTTSAAAARNGTNTFGTPLSVNVSYVYTGLGFGQLINALSGPVTLSAITTMNNE
jgi:hypothetical protein